MQVIVLGGGTSTEREISLKSAAAVTKALDAAGYEVTQIDPAIGLAELEKHNPDCVVFPMLHGAGGEDGIIQRYLEDRQLPFLGTGSKASAVCFDKHLTRQALVAAGLPVAKGDVVTRQTYWNHELAAQPHVLKVSRGGSSIGTLIVSNVQARLPEQVEGIFSLDSQAIIEELVTGTEITVPILGDRALPIIEIRPPTGQDFDYENKYNGQTQELCPPPSLDVDNQAAASQLALGAHRALHCRHLSRTDIIVRPDNTMVILEINTIPGMTENSLYPKAAQAAGLTMEKLMQEFMALIRPGNSINIPKQTII